MGNIKISVIIPVYNAENYIRQCLGSVLNQSMQEIEVICIDDGSTDESLNILEEYALKDNRVKVFHQQNQHAGVARNKGMEAATGEYIHFLDADDFVLDYSYEILYNKAVKYNLDCLKCRSIGFDVLRNVTTDDRLYLFKDVHPEDYNRLLTLKSDSAIYHDISVVPWNGLYKRAFIENNNIRFNSLICVNDRSFFVKVVTNAKRIMITQDWLVIHRINMQDSLISKRALNFDCHFKSIQLINNQLKQDKIDLKVAERMIKHEFYDLRYWYRKFYNDKEYGEKICQGMLEFVKEYNGPCSDFLNEIARERKESRNNILRQPSNQPEIKIFPEASLNPLVSVVVPVYNAQDYLYECLDSITGQTLENIEIICVDDGSTDDSGIILKEYANIDKRIKILRQDNKYAGVARNNGMQIARGEYITFLDADDRFEANMLERLYNYAKELDLDVAVCRLDRFYANKVEKIPWSIKTNMLPKEKVFRGQDIEKDFFNVFIWWPWDKLYKKKYLDSLNIQFQPLRTTNDLYFVCAAVLMAERMSYIDDVLVHHRENLGSSLSKTKEKSYNNFYLALLELRKFLVEHKLYKRYEQDFVNYCLVFSLWHLDTMKGESHCFLYNALREEWYDNLEVVGRKEDYFYDKSRYTRLCAILAEDLKTHLINELTNLQEKLENVNKKLKNVKNELEVTDKKLHKSLHRENSLKQSVSFCIGRVITWIPRKIRGGVRCYNQNGAVYTIKRLAWHVMHLK